MVTRTKTKEVEVVKLTPTQQQIIEEVDNKTEVEKTKEEREKIASELTQLNQELSSYEESVNPLIKPTVDEIVEDNVYSELSRIQAELNVPKNAYNSFGKYKYRNIEDITEAYKKVKGGTFLNFSDKIVQVGERIYIEATATLCYKGETVSVTGYAREPVSKKGMDESQITGAASSYARKYAAGGLFAIDDNKDPDSLSPDQNTGEKDVDINAKVEEYKTKLKDASTMDKLKDVWVACGKEVPKGHSQFPALEKIKNERKDHLLNK